MKRPLRNCGWHGSDSNWACALFSIALLAAGAWDALAAPAGQTVVAGHATFSQQGPLTVIQAGNNSIINYRSFDILANETVQFIQPDSRSRVLNRVLGDGPTSILGNLLANGQVYIANPAGIYFGHGSYINVGGLVAAAGNISDRDFRRQMNRFTGVNGDVVNDGTINAGSISLAGQHVANHGNLTARNGLVTLLAGDEVLVGESGGHVFVNLGKATSPDAPGVENTGTINAGAGRSILAAGDLYSLAVVNSGVIQAHDITLQGKGSGLVQTSGRLDASDRSPGGRGGTVQVLGEKVALTGATIDASGDIAGGTVLVGGDYQGKGDARNAARTLVDRDSTIKADAISQGDGGKVIIWSDEATVFGGQISASGGQIGGNGGFAEVSSKGVLFFDGQVDLAAPAGTVGNLLLDPTDIYVVANDPSNGSFTSDPTLVDDFTDADLSTPLQRTSIDVSTINGAQSQVTLRATRDTFFETPVNIANNSASLLVQSGRDIQVNEPITTSGGAIDLQAGGQIMINKALSALNGDVTLTGSAIGAGLGTTDVTANRLILSGGGDVGKAAQPLNTAVNVIMLKKTGGDSYINESDAVDVFGLTGNGGFNLRAGGAIMVASGSIDGLFVGGINAGSGDITLSSVGNLNIANDLIAKSVDAHSGTGGIGDIIFGQGVRISADKQSYLAGDGRGRLGTNAAARLAGTNSFFYNSNGTDTPSSFIHQQDATIGDLDIASVFQFGGDPRRSPEFYTIQSDDGSVTLMTASKVQGSTLTLNSANSSVTLGAELGQASVLDLASLSTSGASIVLNRLGTTADPSVRTIGGSQTYDGPVTLGVGTTLSGTMVTFKGAVKGTVPGRESLTIDGNAVFGDGPGDFVGNGVNLDFLKVTGTTGLNGGNAVENTVTTAGAQTYGGPVTLGADTTLAGGTLSMGGVVGNNRDLTLNFSGLTDLCAGNFAGVRDLATGNGGTTQLGGTLTTLGSQTYRNDVILCADTTLSGTILRFNKTVNGTVGSPSESLSLTARAGTILFAGAVGNTEPLGTLAIANSGGATFSASTTASTVDLQDTTGAITFGGAVTLNTLTTAAKGYSVALNGSGTITTDTTFLNTGGVTLGNDDGDMITFTGGLDTRAGLTTARGGINTANAHIDIGPLMLGGNTTLNAGNGAINLGAITGGGNSLAVNSGGVTTFGATVGGLSSLTTDDMGSTAINTTTVNATVQDYKDDLTLGANPTLTGTTVTFEKTVNADAAANNRMLTVNAGGVTTFGGAVGNRDVLASLTTDAQGLTGEKTAINTPTVNATAQDYKDDVTLGANPTLTGRTVTFEKTLNADATANNRALTVNAGGVTTFSGAVGNRDVLASLTTDAQSLPGEKTAINTLTVNATVQDYKDDVTLGGDTTLSGTTMTFKGTVNGTTPDRQGLTINGNAVFGDAPGDYVGNTASLHFLAVSGETSFNGGSTGANTVTTAHEQTYNGTVTLGAPTVLASSSGGDITFNSTVTGAQSLEVNTSGVTTFNGAVGSAIPLTSIMTDADGPLVVGANVLTTGDQTYRGQSVRLGTDTKARENIVLQSTNGAIRFNSQANNVNSVLATIFKTSPGDVTIDAMMKFEMGQNEKFVHTGGAAPSQPNPDAMPGNVTIKTASATLSDIAVQGDLVINSPSITLLQRQPVAGQTLNSGLDFVARNITFLGSPMINFGGDSTADQIAIFGTTGNSVGVPDAPGIVKTHIDTPLPFEPKFAQPPNPPVPLDPQPPSPLNLSEALGLIEPVPIEEAAQVEVSPAFNSYERVFSDLFLAVLELQNTLGARNAEAADLLAEIQANIEFFRERHRAWAARADLHEHNPEPCLKCFQEIAGNLQTIPNAKTEIAIDVLKDVLKDFRIKKQLMDEKPDSPGFPQGPVIVQTMNATVPESGYSVKFASAADVLLGNTGRFKSFPKQSSPTSNQMCAGSWCFWTQKDSAQGEKQCLDVRATKDGEFPADIPVPDQRVARSKYER